MYLGKHLDTIKLSTPNGLGGGDINLLLIE